MSKYKCTVIASHPEEGETIRIPEGGSTRLIAEKRATETALSVKARGFTVHALQTKFPSGRIREWDI